MWAVGSSLDLKRAHNPKVAGSNPAPARANPFVLLDAFWPRFESGEKKTSSLDVLKKLAKALGVPVAELLE